MNIAFWLWKAEHCAEERRCYCEDGTENMKVYAVDAAKDKVSVWSCKRVHDLQNYTRTD